MSDTPRTDERVGKLFQGVSEIEIVDSDFARQLERELREANSKLTAALAERDSIEQQAQVAYKVTTDECNAALAENARLTKERDEAKSLCNDATETLNTERADNAKLREQLTAALAERDEAKEGESLVNKEHQSFVEKSLAVYREAIAERDRIASDFRDAENAIRSIQAERDAAITERDEARKITTTPQSIAKQAVTERDDALAEVARLTRERDELHARMAEVRVWHDLGKLAVAIAHGTAIPSSATELDDNPVNCMSVLRAEVAKLREALCTLPAEVAQLRINHGCQCGGFDDPASAFCPLHSSVQSRPFSGKGNNTEGEG